MKPRLFIGSSTESLDIAYAAQENLEYDCEVTVWTQGIFDLSKSTIESLVAALDKFDFALFVFAPDDIAKIRGSEVQTVRDNVVFELGLFVGRIGRKRCFIMAPRGTDDLYFPTDLLGITLATFTPHRQDENITAAIGPACNRIRKSIKGTEVPIEDVLDKSNAIFMPLGYIDRHSFFKKIIVNAPASTEICFISITAHTELHSLQDVIQTAYDKNNKLKGIVVNPYGVEARFRNFFESPNCKTDDAVLNIDAKAVKQSLKISGYGNIEMRYAPVGIQFKVWLSEKEAMIEPYSFGKEPKSHSRGLCGFSQVLYSNTTREYEIIKDHFKKLWDSSTAFWPETTKITELPKEVDLFSRVEIEINTHCNRKCNYCPNSVVEDQRKSCLMEDDLYKKIINELKHLQFRGRLSFHFYGEPLLHPRLESLILYARKNLDKDKVNLVLYTNGERLNDAKYKGLISSGIDRIVVYDPDKKFDPRPKLIVLEDIHINNKGGILGKMKTLDLACFVPTHRLLIGYDGNVLLCYEDVKRQMVFGNVKEESIKDIWSSTEFQIVREDLQNKKRGKYEPCKYCDNQSHIRFGQVNVNHLY